jgi:hypothetical protein
MGKAGALRKRRLVTQDAQDRAELLAELLADHAARHGRPATASEKVPLENIATGMIRIRRLESQGRSSFEERKQLAQWWRAAGFKVDKPEPRPPGNTLLQEYLRERYGAPVAQAPADKSEAAT